jgi:hypothetical protein
MLALQRALETVVTQTLAPVHTEGKWLLTGAGYSSRIQHRIHMLVKRDFLASVTAEMTILIAITSVSLGIQS